MSKSSATQQRRFQSNSKKAQVAAMQSVKKEQRKGKKGMSKAKSASFREALDKDVQSIYALKDTHTTSKTSSSAPEPAESIQGLTDVLRNL